MEKAGNATGEKLLELAGLAFAAVAAQARSALYLDGDEEASQHGASKGFFGGGRESRFPSRAALSLAPSPLGPALSALWPRRVGRATLQLQVRLQPPSTSQALSHSGHVSLPEPRCGLDADHFPIQLQASTNVVVHLPALQPRISSSFVFKTCHLRRSRS